MAKAKLNQKPKIKKKLKLTSKNKFLRPKVIIPIILLTAIVGTFLYMKSNGSTYTFINKFDRMNGGTPQPALKINGQYVIYRKFTGTTRVSSYVGGNQIWGSNQVCAHVKFDHAELSDGVAFQKQYNAYANLRYKSVNGKYDKYSHIPRYVVTGTAKDSGNICITLSDRSNSWLGGAVEVYCNSTANSKIANCEIDMYVDTIYGKI